MGLEDHLPDYHNEDKLGKLVPSQNGGTGHLLRYVSDGEKMLSRRIWTPGTLMSAPGKLLHVSESQLLQMQKGVNGLSHL